MINLLFTLPLFSDFIPLIKFYGNTEPVMVNIQGSDTNQMAERQRFELWRDIVPYWFSKPAPSEESFSFLIIEKRIKCCHEFQKA